MSLIAFFRLKLYVHCTISISRDTTKQSYLLDKLNDVLILQHVSNTDLLWVMLDRGAPNKRVFELLDDAFVNTIAKV